MYPHTTVQGNLTGAPRVTTLDGGRQVANFQIACNNQHRDYETNQWVEDPTTFVPCVAWGRFARVVATWPKGRWSMVAGTLRTQQWTKDDERRERLVVNVDVIDDPAIFTRTDAAETTKTTGWEDTPIANPGG